MTDPNAPVRKAHHAARRHLSGVHARREAAQALSEVLQAAMQENAAQAVPLPPPEATP